MPQYQRLREILAREKYPHSFIFKFVGRNSPDFQKGVSDLELEFPSLVLQSRRQSQSQKHISVTYSLEANCPEDIIEVYQSIAKIKDVLVVL